MKEHWTKTVQFRKQTTLNNSEIVLIRRFFLQEMSTSIMKITDSSPVYLHGEELLLFMYVRFSAIIHKN